MLSYFYFALQEQQFSLIFNFLDLVFNRVFAYPCFTNRSLIALTWASNSEFVQQILLIRRAWL